VPEAIGIRGEKRTKRRGKTRKERKKEIRGTGGKDQCTGMGNKAFKGAKVKEDKNTGI